MSDYSSWDDRLREMNIDPDTLEDWSTVDVPGVEADDSVPVVKQAKRSKYRNKKVEYDGCKFDSIAEYDRYRVLVQMQRDGVIEALQVHPRFLLQAAFTDAWGKRHRKIEYEADFSYAMVDDPMQIVVEDVKGMETAVFKIKKKLFIKLYPQIRFEQVNVKRKTK